MSSRVEHPRISRDDLEDRVRYGEKLAAVCDIMAQRMGHDELAAVLGKVAKFRACQAGDVLIQQV